MLITEEYRQTQKELHKNPDYGKASEAYAPLVARMIDKFEIDELLDYGAGKLRLLKTIADNRLVNRKFRYIPYEPADDRYSDRPMPCEMVTCIDVLEHVEPDLLENVLDDLKRITGRVGFFTIHTGPAVKVLPDGRNAHLTQEGMSFWLPKLAERFDIQTIQKVPNGFWALVSKQ